MTAVKKMSTQAQVAKLIRADLKAAFPGVKFRVSISACYNVNVFHSLDENGSQMLRVICKRYQLGSFDGMTDSYEFNNKDKSIPQVEYVLIQREWTA